MARLPPAACLNPAPEIADIHRAAGGASAAVWPNAAGVVSPRATIAMPNARTARPEWAGGRIRTIRLYPRNGGRFRESGAGTIDRRYVGKFVGLHGQPRYLLLMRYTTAVAIAAALLVATGCGANPTAPPATRVPPVNLSPVAPAPVVEGPFEITGLVTDEQGAPVVGAKLSIWATTRATGCAGRFLCGPMMPGGTRSRFRLIHRGVQEGSARAEVVAEGHDQFRRSIYDPVRHRVENFRLRRIRRIAAGETMVLAVSVDNGDCHGWLWSPAQRLPASRRHLAAN